MSVARKRIFPHKDTAKSAVIIGLNFSPFDKYSAGFLPFLLYFKCAVQLFVFRLYFCSASADSFERWNAVEKSVNKDLLKRFIKHSRIIMLTNFQIKQFIAISCYRIFYHNSIYGIFNCIK